VLSEHKCAGNCPDCDTDQDILRNGTRKEVRGDISQLNQGDDYIYLQL